MKLGIGGALLWAAVEVGWSQSYTAYTFAGGAPPLTPIAAVNAAIAYPTGVATDAAGNVYFGSSLHCVFKLERNGVLTRVAGTCRAGYSGDGGPATSAQLSNPRGLAVDAAGNLYIADSANNRVRKVTQDGLIATVAGGGSGTYSGDGSPAASVRLSNPEGVAVDALGNLYVADTGNSTIWKVIPSNKIVRVTGSGSGYFGDGGPAVAAWLNHPTSLAFDNAGNLYIADTNNMRIRKITAGGIITTVAGNGTQGYLGDGGPATSAQLGFPQGLATDTRGNLYIVDVIHIRKLTPDGMITSIAGDANPGDLGDGGPATSARFGVFMYGLASDVSGNLYVADGGNFRVRKITPGGMITTVAGNGREIYLGDGGPATSVQLSAVQGLALDAANNLYFSDGSRVRKVTPGGIITTVAGTGVAGYSGDGGPATSAQLSSPQGLALDAANNLYIADRFRVRKVKPSGVITTVAGNGNPGFGGDGGPATSAYVDPGWGLAVDTDGNLYIADTHNLRFRKVTPDGVITTVAGSGNPGYSGDGGPATSAGLGFPLYGVAVDASGNLYIADGINSRVRKVTPGGVITTVAGTGVAGYSGDGGPATSAQLSLPQGVAVDVGGNIYIADTANSRIRKVSPDGIITTIAGDGQFNYAGDSEAATSAQFGYPLAVAVDAIGTVYIAANTAVRLLQPVTVSTRADFNGDGKPDVLWQNDATRQVSVWYLGSTQGNIRVSEAWLAANGPQGWRVVGTADFNSDGKPDLVWQNDNTRQVAVWYLGGAQGNTLLGDAWLASNGPQGWRVVGTGDLNGDGKPDLVWQHDTTRQVAVWYLGGAQGNTFLSDAWLASNSAVGWRIVGLADFNGDSKPDLIWQNDSTRQVSVWYLGGAQGNTYLGDTWLASTGPQSWRVAGVADCNHDGKPDLLWQHDTTRQVVVWYLGGPQGNTYLTDAWLAQSGPQGWTLIAR